MRRIEKEFGFHWKRIFEKCYHPWPFCLKRLFFTPFDSDKLLDFMFRWNLLSEEWEKEKSMSSSSQNSLFYYLRFWLVMIFQIWTPIHCFIIQHYPVTRIHGNSEIERVQLIQLFMWMVWINEIWYSPTQYAMCHWIASNNSFDDERVLIFLCFYFVKNIMRFNL